MKKDDIRNKKNRNKNIKNRDVKQESKFEEMETAEEFGEGWFAAGVATGMAIGVGVVILT